MSYWGAIFIKTKAKQRNKNKNTRKISAHERKAMNFRVNEWKWISNKLLEGEIRWFFFFLQISFVYFQNKVVNISFSVVFCWSFNEEQKLCIENAFWWAHACVALVLSALDVIFSQKIPSRCMRTKWSLWVAALEVKNMPGIGSQRVTGSNHFCMQIIRRHSKDIVGSGYISIPVYLFIEKVSSLEIKKLSHG